jgi:hypothetical protein
MDHCVLDLGTHSSMPGRQKDWDLAAAEMLSSASIACSFVSFKVPCTQALDLQGDSLFRPRTGAVATSCTHILTSAVLSELHGFGSIRSSASTDAGFHNHCVTYSQRMRAPENC